MRSVARTLRRPAELADAGLVPPDRLADLERVAAQYAVAISPAMAALIDPADPADPIARQFVPDPAELTVAATERGDPIGDDAKSPLAGIVHRYPDRVLLKLVHVCPVYCRFCFRREQVGPRGRPALSPAELAGALDYIGARPDIWEVILTGGDPLILSARRLRAVVRALAAIEHVKIIRVHTRVPVAAPERVTRELVRALKAPGKASYVVVHVNHARELTPQARAACARFIDAGVPMLESVGAAARRQRRRIDARRTHARLGREPHQAVLPAPGRSRARHRASAHQRRDRTGPDAIVAPQPLGAVPADLCARCPGRLRQGADRADISGAGAAAGRRL